MGFLGLGSDDDSGESDGGDTPQNREVASRSESGEASTSVEGINPNYSVQFDPKTAVGEMDRQLMISGAKGGPYAGEWPREMFESAYNKDEPPTWIGYNESPQTGLREVPINHDSWFRHAAVFGTTGYGKTTFLKNLMVQWAYGGYGFCFIDPKGDGVIDILREIPEHRLDDVVWIDPAAPATADRIVGLNFLQAGVDREDERAFDKEVEAVVDDLRNIIRNENYWGARMDGIFNTICRGMVRSEKSYTLVDMYYVLLDEQYRQYFVEDVDDEAVRKYSRIIAEEMEQQDLDPLLRRIKKLVESRVTREVIAHKDSTVNIKQAVEDGRIILVKNDLPDGDARRMISTGVMRRIWAAAQARIAVPEEERTPYYMVIDEFDDVVSEDSDIERMLSKARSMRLSLTLCCQQPSQLPEETRKAIFGNCDNLLAMNPSEPGDAKLIMKRFGSYTADQLTDLGQFKMFTRISLGAEQSNPFVTQTFPDYPPLRTPEEAEQVKKQSLERHGKPRLDPDNIFGDAIIGRSEYDMDEDSVFGDDNGGDGVDGDGNISTGLVLESIYAEAKQQQNNVERVMTPAENTPAD